MTPATRTRLARMLTDELGLGADRGRVERALDLGTQAVAEVAAATGHDRDAAIARWARTIANGPAMLAALASTDERIEAIADLDAAIDRELRGRLARRGAA